jgi:hypothetical protein
MGPRNDFMASAYVMLLDKLLLDANPVCWQTVYSIILAV